MKIIDLLNKVANGEEVPEKIQMEGLVYTYEADEFGAYDYYCGEINRYFMDMHNILRSVNAEIETIKDKPKKIEKIPILILGNSRENKSSLELGQLRADLDILANQLNLVIKKQAEIIDKINEMENK